MNVNNPIFQSGVLQGVNGKPAGAGNPFGGRNQQAQGAGGPNAGQIQFDQVVGSAIQGASAATANSLTTAANVGSSQDPQKLAILKQAQLRADFALDLLNSLVGFRSRQQQKLSQLLSA